MGRKTNEVDYTTEKHYPSGKLKSRILPSGRGAEWYESGAILAKRTPLSEDERDVYQESSFYESGALKSEAECIDDSGVERLYRGVLKKFYENGNLKYTVTYTESHEKEGRELFYNEDGSESKCLYFFENEEVSEEQYNAAEEARRLKEEQRAAERAERGEPKKTKCYWVQLKSFRRISEKCYTAEDYNGNSDLIPASQVFGELEGALLISAWILSKKSLNYSFKSPQWAV